MIKVFVPPAKDVKLSIDRLITKDLLQRDEKDRELIRYKDWFICTKLNFHNKHKTILFLSNQGWILAIAVIGPAFTTVSPTTPSEGKKNDRKNEY